MRGWGLAWVAAPLLLGAAPALTVTQGWSRATYGAGATAVGYLTVTNRGAADVLTGAACAGAGGTTLHRTESLMKMGTMSMDHMAAMDRVDIPAGGAVTFGPGGMHLMLMDMARPLRVSDRVACTLHFAQAGDVAVRLVVQGPGDTAYSPLP